MTLLEAIYRIGVGAAIVSLTALGPGSVMCGILGCFGSRSFWIGFGMGVIIVGMIDICEPLKQAIIRRWFSGRESSSQ